jgi:hypothetical protein
VEAAEPEEAGEGWLKMLEGAPNRLMGIVNDLDQEQFKDIATRLLKNMQFNILDVSASASSLDFTATREDDGSLESYLIRAKRGTRKATPDDLQQIVGKKKGGRELKPVFISSTGFTEEASKYSELLNVSLADGEKFALLLKKFNLEDELENASKQKVLKAEGNRFLPSIDELENLMRWGNDFHGSGNYIKAVEYYDKALTLKPNYDLAWLMKGNTLSALGKHEEALECFKKVLEIKPDSTEGWYNLGSTLYALERFEEEIQCYDEVTEAAA